MNIGRRGIFRLLLICFACTGVCFAQGTGKRPDKEEDNYVTLINAKYAKLLVGDDGLHYREVKGPATFLHNNAYLQCDSAIWNIDAEVIDCYGNVKLIQNGTMLKSEHLNYDIPRDLAKFSGEVVELIDKKKNTLRTNDLDYNTRDSIAEFRRGGAMKAEDGSVIEGRTGVYNSKERTFTFSRDVEMFTDSLFIRTTSLTYKEEDGKAYFGPSTYMWQGSGFLRADAGWFDNGENVAHFNNSVYMNTPEYEVWCDEIDYFRNIARADLYHDIRLLDTLHKTAWFANRAEIAQDSILNADVRLTVDPSLIYYGETEAGQPDSLYCRADTLRFFTRRVCDIGSQEKEASQKRKESIIFDAIAEAERNAKAAYEKKRAEAEAASAAGIARAKRESLAREKAIRDSVNRAEDSLRVLTDSLQKIGMTLEAYNDTLAAVAKRLEEKRIADSIAAIVPPDSLQLALMEAEKAEELARQAIADSLAALPDTTQLRYMEAAGNIRMYRSDLQARCDSLTFCELDSVAVLKMDPVLWNEGVNQLTSDVMYLYIKDGALHRGNMVDNAMIVSYEDSLYYDQIKSAEMMGHFYENALTRYDALGGVNAIFYMREKEIVTTANIKEARSLSVTMKNGTAERLKYYDQVKSDAHPVFVMTEKERYMKGFKWRGEERPLTPEEITEKKIPESQRSRYDWMDKPYFKVTNRYFQDYMTSIYKEIADRNAAHERELFVRDSTSRAVQDSIRIYREALADLENGLGPAEEAIEEMPLQDFVEIARDSLPEMPIRHYIDTISPRMPAVDSVVEVAEDTLSAAVVKLPENINDAIKKPIEKRKVEAKETEVAGVVEAAVQKVEGPEEKLSRSERRAIKRAERAARRSERKAARRAARQLRKARKLE